MNTSLHRVGELLTEISREYGIMGMNVTLMEKGRKSPEEAAKEFVERQEKIKTYLDEIGTIQKRSRALVNEAR
jgi:hypothetical protein